MDEKCPKGRNRKTEIRDRHMGGGIFAQHGIKKKKQENRNTEKWGNRKTGKTGKQENRKTGKQTNRNFDLGPKKATFYGARGERDNAPY